MAKLRRLLHVFNFPRAVCDHMVGEHHSTSHRLAVGSVVICLGVGIAFVGGSLHHTNLALAFILDAIGYLVHGIGAVPFVELVLAEKAVETAVEAALVFPAIQLLDDEVEGLD